MKPLKKLILILSCAHLLCLNLFGNDKVKALQDEIARLQDQLAVAKSEAKTSGNYHKIKIGNLTIGGALRANLALGDYNDSFGGEDASGPSRGGHGGNISLDTFRINLDYSNDDLIGKVDYRWHNGYNFFHTAYVGYNLDDAQLRVGLNRVPFGIGNWGPANSWFFDQHYYVGLSDDMDVGIKYSKTFESWSLDLAYYVGSEPNWRGSNSDGARYSFDILDTGPGTYKENGQVNARLVKKIVTGDLESNIGVSLQYGKLDGNDTEDADAFAGSLHMKSSYNQWGLKAQLTAYDYDSHNDIMTGGFFDYTTQIASKGWIPSLAVNYLWNVDSIDWIDSINFYNDYSILIKEGRNASGEFSDCALNVLGAAVAKGNWYIYLDWAYSDGNEFVSEQPYNTLGENQGNDWNSRYNINLGYYV